MEPQLGHQSYLKVQTHRIETSGVGSSSLSDLMARRCLDDAICPHGRDLLLRAKIIPDWFSKLAVQLEVSHLRQQVRAGQVLQPGACGGHEVHTRHINVSAPVGPHSVAQFLQNVLLGRLGLRQAGEELRDILKHN